MSPACIYPGMLQQCWQHMSAMLQSRLPVSHNVTSLTQQGRLVRVVPSDMIVSTSSRRTKLVRGDDTQLMMISPLMK